MMTKLIKRGEQAARERQRERVRQLADQLKGLFGEGAVEVDEARVLVRGRGIVKRWLIDPSLRFLAGGFK
jgi:hypothetical protein